MGRVLWHKDNKHVSWPSSCAEHPISLLLCCSHLNVTSVSLSAWDSRGDVYNAGVDNMLQWYLLLLKPLYLRGKSTEIIKYTALHGQIKAAKAGFWSPLHLPSKLIRRCRNFKISSLNMDEKSRWKLTFISGEDLKADSLITWCILRAEPEVGFCLLGWKEQKSAFEILVMLAASILSLKGKF